MKLITAFLLTICSFGALAQTGQTQDALGITVNAPSEAVYSMLQPFEAQLANFRCGLKPLPPLGCRVGACVCDSNGNNCQWTFICSMPLAYSEPELRNEPIY